MQVVLLQLPLIKEEAQVKTLIKKLGPPLVTLLSEEAEIQYVALRNINLIVQKHPEVLSYEIKVRPKSSCVLASFCSKMSCSMQLPTCM